MLAMGIDIGSSSTELVVMDEAKKILVALDRQIGTGSDGLDELLDQLWQEMKLKPADMDAVVATGYGRNYVDFATHRVSEISCHAKGVHYFIPEVRTIIDIGGQDAKAIRVNETGNVDNFCMNDKCAAGTGRFLDVMARVLNVDISQMGALSAGSKETVNISSTCTVFAESEVISQLSARKDKADIAAGIHRSVATRAGSLAYRVGIEPTVVLTGGVALNTSVVEAMQNELGCKIVLTPCPQLTGAAGAAVIGWEKMKKQRK